MEHRRKVVVVDLDGEETIANQIAFLELRHYQDMDAVRDFLRRAGACNTIDELLRVILKDYDVKIKEDP